MNFDYYASLAERKVCLKKVKVNEFSLASGFVDGCASSFAIAEIERAEAEEREKKVQKNSQEGKDAEKERKDAENRKNKARRCYMKRASDLKDLKLPPDLRFEPDFTHLPDPSWFGIEVEFELLSPWYSRDDRPFHVLDNPVRKDRVFGVPFMSAASWKGLLRWAFKMRTGLIDLGDKKNSDKDNKQFKMQEVFLFGNERAEGEEFSRGALMFYPTWFDKVGFEVINPHKRKTRAGTQPIYYEVVPAGTKGKLQLLYAPLPGRMERPDVNPIEAMEKLVDAIQQLLERYGFSAKRTAGWGAAKAGVSTLYFMEGSWMDQCAVSVYGSKEYIPPEDKFKVLIDEDGYPIKILLDENGNLLSKTRWKRLGDKKPHSCTNADFEAFKAWYKIHGEEYRRRMNKGKEDVQSPRIRKLPANTLAEFKTLIGKLKDARKGGDQ